MNADVDDDVDAGAREGIAVGGAEAPSASNVGTIGSAAGASPLAA